MPAHGMSAGPPGVGDRIARAGAVAAGHPGIDRAPDDDSDLRSDILVVPHHGSRTSSTDAFLDAVRPRVAVIQVGYRSRYGHPAPVVVARYQARGIAVVRTDHCGAWSWREGDGVCTRAMRRRYWGWQGTSGSEPVGPGTAGGEAAASAAPAGSDVAVQLGDTRRAARRIASLREGL